MASQAKKMDPTKAITSDPNIQAVRSETVDEDEIAVRAYELWHERGCPIGTPEVDWLRIARKDCGARSCVNHDHRHRRNRS